MGTPLVEAEQDRSIRVEDLPEVVMGGRGLGLAKQRLVPPEAARHIAHPDDCPRSLHGAVCSLTSCGSCGLARPCGLCTRVGCQRHVRRHAGSRPFQARSARSAPCAFDSCLQSELPGSPLRSAFGFMSRQGRTACQNSLFSDSLHDDVLSLAARRRLLVPHHEASLRHLYDPPFIENLAIACDR